jgi:hypothetical protein
MKWIWCPAMIAFSNKQRQCCPQVVQLTEVVRDCMRLQRLPMNSGSSSSPGVPGSRTQEVGRRKADLLSTRSKTLIRRSHPGNSVQRAGHHKSGHDLFPHTR